MMKPGDEIVFSGATYVAGDARLLRVFLGFDPDDSVWSIVCDYCKQACKLRICLATLYDDEAGKRCAICGCDDDPIYFFRKPEVDHEAGT